MSDLAPNTEQAEQAILAWIRQQVGYGVTALKKERPYNEIQNAINFVTGEQFPLRTKAISRLVDNRLRKVAIDTISTMTDVRPIWTYTTNIEQYKDQAEILSKLARGWWLNTHTDRRLQSILMYSLVGGSGYGVLTWNPSLPGGGDLELIPYDPRDVIPIDPVFSETIQDWRGIVLRQRLSVETIRKMYPAKAALVGGTKGSWFGPPMRDGSTSGMYNIASTMWNVLTRGNERPATELDGVDLIRVYVKDDSLNTTDHMIPMGEPGSNWYYEVQPLGSEQDGRIVGIEEARLYPRGRLIICTPDTILRDIPNPHWHGMFPVIRFTLDPLPWSLLGSAILGDLIPLQNALNEALRGAEDGLGQWIQRGVIADKRSISRQALNELDTRKAGMKAYLNPVAGEGFKIVDGPAPQVFDIYMKMIEYAKQEIEDLAGMRGVQALAQMQQTPSADTMEKFLDALSPTLRLRSQAMYTSLAELAQMLKVSFFQYYDTRRRVEYLGKDGVTLQDLDYDPGNMIPADKEGKSTRLTRATAHQKNFTFSVAPNSFLNISHTSHKMLMLQLMRQNLMDPWSVWEAFDVSGVGPAPAETIPERIIEAKKQGLLQGPTPEMVNLQQELMMAQMRMQLAQAKQQEFMGPGGIGPPGNPQRGVGPKGGRPPTGQQVPRMETREGGTRPLVSESP